jgi:2-keto-4-pentenoate hydratase
LIADNACAHFFVLGTAAAESWRRIDLAGHRVLARTNDGNLCHGIGRNVLGDPRIALVWFLDEMSRIKITIRADQVVTTGTCLQPIAITNGVRVVGDFGVLGSVSVNVI